jgi:hypothetical protein
MADEVDDAAAPGEDVPAGASAEEIKVKMREALHRKQQGAHAGEAHLQGRQAARGVHGKEGGQREFRRKAGS